MRSDYDREANFKKYRTFAFRDGNSTGNPVLDSRIKTDIKLLALERDTFRDLIAQAMEITPDFDQVIRARLDA